jgi:hypothetical protein
LPAFAELVPVLLNESSIGATTIHVSAEEVKIMEEFGPVLEIGRAHV